MKNVSRYSLVCVMVPLVISLFLLVACGEDDDNDVPTGTVTPTVTPTDEATPEPANDVVITIGHITDITGPGAAAHEYIRMALEDLAGYFNEQSIIPGVELKVIEYDQQNDPSKDIPGYEWLREGGADVVFGATQSPPLTLKNRVVDDGVLLFAAATDLNAISPLGHVFCVGTIPQYDAYTLLKWIAENDWDYETNGPAKIGGAGWDDSHTGPVLNAMQEYAEAHPDQFEWVGGHLAPLGTFTWGPEVEALKDCDYVYPGIVMVNFVREYRIAGHAGKIIGTDAQAAFFGLIDDAKLWDEIDGMLFLKSSRWWNEEGLIVNLAKQLLHENHETQAQEIISSGVGYMALSQVYQMFNIIADAAKTVGPQNLDSQALYEAATFFALTVDGIQRYSFNETKRDSVDVYAMYEARAEGEDIFRLNEEWFPTVREP